MKNAFILTLFLFSTGAIADGKQILEEQCMACHMVDGRGGEKKAAPPMYAVWHHYRQAHPQKVAFVRAITAWLQQPHKANAVMKGAVRKFGLMEKLELSAEQAHRVAEHLYARTFALPERYLTHYNQSHGTVEHGYDGNETQAAHDAHQQQH